MPTSEREKHASEPLVRVHRVQVTSKDRWLTDPVEGLVKRREQIMRPADDHRIVHDGETYEAEDGTFEVPESVAQHLLRQPGWHEGDSPFAPDDDGLGAEEANTPRRRRARH